MKLEVYEVMMMKKLIKHPSYEVRSNEKDCEEK